ncbi:MAG: glycosyltransferase [Helicobacteraceae bacterium]|jgi:glycosyltransferase involved in cell wall biosynthesis|nr:glycosyltransferase [Helicobacteraceae bacterium]
MIDKPLVAIIMPTYKRQSLLPRAIRSALNQTYKNIEILVCDDEKSVETKEIVASFADNRLRYIENARTKGACGARNTGIYAALGEYCVFLDDDDELLSDAIETYVKHTPKEAAFGYGWRQFCSSDDDKINIHKHGESMDFNYLVKCGSNAAGPNIFVLKSRLEAIGGYDETLAACQDYDLNLRLTKHFANAKGIRKVIVNYYEHIGERISNNRAKRYKGMRLIALKYRKDFPKKMLLRYVYRTRRRYYRQIILKRAFAWLPIGKALDELRRYLKYKLFGVKIK